MMTGTGTQQDPFIFGSFIELIEMQLEDSSYTNYYEYGGTVTEENLDDYGGEPLADSIEFKGYIDFKGLTILNLRTTNVYPIILHGKLSNVSFKNVIWTATGNRMSFMGYGNNDDDFKGLYNVSVYCNINTNLTGTDSRWCFLDVYQNTKPIDKCVFKIAGRLTVVGSYSIGGTPRVINHGGVVSDTNIQFDNFTFAKNSGNGTFLIVNRTVSPIAIAMIGCYIGGKLIFDGGNDYALTFQLDTTYATVTQTVIDLETDATISKTTKGLVLFNSTKAPNFVADATNGLIGATDEQMHSATDLQALGFPCYEVTS